MLQFYWLVANKHKKKKKKVYISSECKNSRNEHKAKYVKILNIFILMAKKKKKNPSHL